MNIIETLLSEQSKSGNIANTRPFLVQLSKTVASRVFRDMVAIQETNNPDAQVFGLKYLTKDDKTLHNNSVNVTGAAGLFKDQIDSLTPGASVIKNKLYKFEDGSVYQSLANATLDASEDFLIKSIINGHIRLFSDAAETSYYEDQNPSEVKFEIQKWVVPCKTRKVQIKASQELVQDMESNGLDSVKIMEDTLASAIVNEVNKDIISKLITVSKRYDNKNVGVENGFVDLSSRKDPIWQIGRDINAMIGAASADILSNTTYSATYVIVSPNVYGLLCGAGLVIMNEESEMTRSHGYLKSGLKIYVDTYNKFDYFVVGCKHNIHVSEHGIQDNRSDEEYDNDDLIGSLYYMPYLEEDGSSIYVIRDPDNFQHNIMLMTRYGLSINPFMTDSNKNNKGDDWNNLIGKSLLSNIVGLKLA